MNFHHSVMPFAMRTMWLLFLSSSIAHASPIQTPSVSELDNHSNAEPLSIPDPRTHTAHSQQVLAIVKIQNRYRIPPSRVQAIVSTTHQVANEHHLDPVLLLSIMAAESSFDTKATSAHGAVGLMQALPQAHQDKITKLGLQNSQLHQISPNIRLGALIFKDCLQKSHGNIQSALQRYNGSIHDHKASYARKVMRFYEWLTHEA